MSEVHDRRQTAVDKVLDPDAPPPPGIERIDEESPVVAVAQGHLALQFALTGIRVEEIDDPSRAENVVAELLSGTAEMIIIDDRFRREFSDRLTETLDEHSGLPLVVYCPSFEQDVAGAEAAMSSELKRVIGYEIKI